MNLLSLFLHQDDTRDRMPMTRRRSKDLLRTGSRTAVPFVPVSPVPWGPKGPTGVVEPTLVEEMASMS